MWDWKEGLSTENISRIEEAVACLLPSDREDAARALAKLSHHASQAVKGLLPFSPLHEFGVEG